MVEMVGNAIKNGLNLHPNVPKSVGVWGSAPDPPVWHRREKEAPIPIFAPGARNPRYATEAV